MSKAILIAIAILLATSSASAQVPCAQRDKIIQWLAIKHKEQPVATGISMKGALIEVLSTKDGNTWTILLTAPNGISCVVDSGQAWQPKTREFDLAEPQA